MGSNLYYGGRQIALFNEYKKFARIQSKEFDRTTNLPHEISVIFKDLDYTGISETKSSRFDEKTLVVICKHPKEFQVFSQSLSLSSGKKLFNAITETGVREVYICQSEKRVVQ